MNRDSRAGAEPASPTFDRSMDMSGAKPGNHNRRFKGALSGLGGPCQVIANSPTARIGMMSWIAAALVLCLIGVALAFNFPPLTGRVVDQANIISAQGRSDLETKLKDLENKSGIQLVVATVKSLEGSDIETYANELFRNWKLGEAKKNNGVLLLVAPNEHKVRIEVGLWSRRHADGCTVVGHYFKRHRTALQGQRFYRRYRARGRWHYQRAEWGHRGLAAEAQCSHRRFSAAVQ